MSKGPPSWRIQPLRGLGKVTVLTLIYLALLCCGERQRDGYERTKRPNILLITTDYTRSADMEVLGRPLQMPHIKELLDHGVLFARHSSVSPICMPARASIVTGTYPHSHSLWDNQSISINRPDRPLLMRDLKRAGYMTIGIGKMHFYPFQADYYFDHRVSLEGKDRDYRDDDYERFLNQNGSSRRALRKQRTGNGLPAGQDLYPWPVAEHLHPDHFVGQMAVQALSDERLIREKPFFLWASFTGPHNPWNPPQRFFDLYRDLDRIPDASFVKGELATKPLEYSRHRYGYGSDLLAVYDSLSETEQRLFRKRVKVAHFASLSFVDEQIGRILEKLGEKGLLDHTVIIFTSDHGSALFDNEMLHKGSPFPTQSLVPLVVSGPGSYVKPGKRSGFTSHVDLYPTLMELAGNPAYGKVEGSSLLPMFLSDTVNIHDFVVLESSLVTSIMTDRWLAGFHHTTGQVELYDLKRDPMCHFNVISNHPANQVTVDSLQAALVSWRRETGPEVTVDENPLDWKLEVLGNPTELLKLRDGYVKAYHGLTTLDSSRPGITGKKARRILEHLEK